MHPRTDPTATTDPSTGSTTFVDADGRTWSMRQVTMFAPDGPPIMPSVTGTSYPTETDDEIANDFRAVKLKVGGDGNVWEYTEVYPPKTRVSAALAKDRAGVWGYGTIGPNGDAVYVEEPSTRPAIQPIRPRDYTAIRSGEAVRRSVSERQPYALPSSARSTSASDGRTPFVELTTTQAYRNEVFGGPQQATPRMIIGTDDRTWLPDDQLRSSLGKVEISLTADPWPTDAGCSAHMIGRATAISAAHCFWNVYTNYWYSVRSWAVGVVHATNIYDLLYGPFTGCYWVTIPLAFETQHDLADDWAVIDFENTGCSIAWPGDVVGWTAFMVDADPTATIDSPSYLNAYDVLSPLPPQPPDTDYFAPSLIVRSAGPWSTAILSGSGGTALTTTLDTTGGASGGGLMQPVNPYTQAPVFVGTISREDVPNNANYARRLDDNIWSFTQDNCAEW